MKDRIMEKLLDIAAKGFQIQIYYEENCNCFCFNLSKDDKHITKTVSSERITFTQGLYIGEVIDDAVMEFLIRESNDKELEKENCSI